MSAAGEGRSADARDPRGRDDRSGFTLLEIVIALVILAVGALGLAATTLNVVRSAMIAELRTERVAARRAVIETVRATPYDEIGSGSETIGDYVVEWTLREEKSDLKELAVVTVGPAAASGASTGGGSVRQDASDTITYRILKP